MGTTLLARGAVVLVLCSFSVAAASVAPTAEQPLSLTQAIEYALQHNDELKSFREEQDIHEAGRMKAGLPPNPTLEFEADTGALTGSSDESTLSVGISQELLLGGKREKRQALAGNALEAYRWQLADRERLLREAVKAAFTDLLLAEQRVALADQSAVLGRQLLDVARERLAAGDIPELEMNLVKVELARSEGARIEAAKTLFQTQAKLATLLGLPPESRFAYEGKLEPEPPPTEPLADLKRRAHDRRPDLKALEAEQNRGNAEILLARAEAVPNITAGIAVTREASSIEVGGIEAKDTDYLVGVRLSMPIPLFDRNQAAVREAAARRNSGETRLQAARRNVDREVESAYAGYLNSDKVLSLFRAEIIPQLEENLKLTQEAYRLGEVGVLAVIQEQKKFYEVSDAFLAALHDRQTALVRLESATAAIYGGGAQ